MSEIDDLVSKIIEEFHRKVPFDPQKRNIVGGIIRETPDEISRISSDFKTHEIDKVVTNENDFLLGSVISFIYYKFLHLCVLEAYHITHEDWTANDKIEQARDTTFVKVAALSPLHSNKSSIPMVRVGLLIDDLSNQSNFDQTGYVNTIIDA